MTNTLMYAWKRTLPGREKLSAAHFEDFFNYLAGLQKDGQIASFEPILLEPNGSSLNGFFLIRGDEAKLHEVTASEQWWDHLIRSMMHLDTPALLRGMSGSLVEERMKAWASKIPS